MDRNNFFPLYSALQFITLFFRSTILDSQLKAKVNILHMFCYRSHFISGEPADPLGPPGHAPALFSLTSPWCLFGYSDDDEVAVVLIIPASGCGGPPSADAV